MLKYVKLFLISILSFNLFKISYDINSILLLPSYSLSLKINCISIFLGIIFPYVIKELEIS